MNLLDSLLDAIVRLDGDALVMHVGEKPYVVTTKEGTNEFRGPVSWGQVELSSRELTADAVGGMLGQILPLDQRAALDDYGATEYEVTSASNQLERFTIVAARGGDDIWLEIRRHSKPKPEPAAAPVAAVAPVEQPVAQTVTARSEMPVAVAVTAPEEQVEMQPEVVPHETPAEAVSTEAPRETIVVIDESVYVEAPDADLDISASAVSELQETDSVEEILDIEPQPFTFESEVESELLTVTHDLGDDVMTEGDLGELLRASAAAITTGDDHEHETPDWLKEEAITDLTAQLFSASVSSDSPPATEVTRPKAELRAVVVEVVESSAVDDLQVPIPVESSDTQEVEDLRLELPIEDREEPQPAAVAVAFAKTRQPEPEESAPLIEAAPVALSAEAVPEEPQVAAERVAEVPAAQPAAADMEPQPIAETTAELLAAEPAETITAADEEVSAPRPPAIVVPLSRHPKADAVVGPRAVAGTTLQRLLRLAATRGAATVYVVPQSAPMVRVDGEFSTLEGEPAPSATVIERLIADVLPAGRDAASTSSEWLIDVPEIGRVRCVTFRDHRGPGVIFRMVPARAISADQLGLSAEVQALSTEADGLILVTGARGSGKSTLLTSFVDLINRTRSDHIITTESQIEFVHESKRSFVSQREVRGDGDAFVAAVRAACREEADVLVIDDMRTPEAVSLVLEAAECGRLVCASVPGLSIASALERIIEMFPAERREKVQASLAGSLRGVVSQILLRKLRGGRVAAREVLFNTPAVASLILEGKIFELQAAIENGRRAGMMSFAESLAALVREGTVHPSHAYRKAPNREQFVAILRREGVDISVAERLA